MLGVRFQLSDRSRVSKTALLLELEQLLESRHASDERTVLVVDEAQSLPHELLEEIRLLANVDAGGRRSMSVIMAGQPELAERLNTHELRQFKQRVALRCELKPLDLSETAAYVTGRIAAAGGAASKVVTREALELIHARAGGIPRTINVIADNTLLAAFAAGRRPAVASMVQEVCRDFDLGAPADRDAAGRVDARSPVPAQRRALAPAFAPPTPVSVGSSTFGSLFGAPRPRRRRFSFFS
jgi:type II secretory pathway predicted ATPase ExeA